MSDFIHIGIRTAVQSLSYPQICSSINFYPCRDCRSSQHRSSPLPSIADECGFEDLAYDFYVQAFSVYEDSISESRAQLQAITLIIGTLAGAKVFNFDTLITKAALHGAKLLKKSHQATAVGLAQSNS